jgi:hypothetical protein
MTRRRKTDPRRRALRAAKQRRYRKNRDNGWKCLNVRYNAVILDWLIRNHHVNEPTNRAAIEQAVEKMLLDLALNS